MPSIDEFFTLIKEGWNLVGNLAGQVKAAAGRALDSNFVLSIRDGIMGYFRAVKKFTLILAAAAFAPLLIVIPCLLLHRPYGFLYASYAIWVGLVTVAAIIFLYPVILLARLLKRALPELYEELVWPLVPILDILHVAISVALFFYIFPIWNNPGALPILLLIVIAWLLGPWAVYGTKLKSVFVFLRAAQLLFLLGVTLLTIAFPVPMQHLQWYAGRAVTAKIRPAQQKEVTAEWESISWFTQEGEPNAWFSHTDQRGYRIFAMPGFDPDTNQELKPADAAIREKIVATFKSEKLARQLAEQAASRVAAQKVELEKKQRETEALTAAKLQEQQATADRERARVEAERSLVESRERLITDFVSRAYIKKVSPLTALAAFDASRKHDAVLSERLSRVLSKASVPNDWKVFRPAFLTSPYFSDLAAGNHSSQSMFKVGDFCDQLVVIETQKATTKITKPAELLSTELLLKMRLFAAVDGQLAASIEIRSKGVGFSEADSLANALDRIEKELVRVAPELGAKISSTK